MPSAYPFPPGYPDGFPQPFCNLTIGKQAYETPTTCFEARNPTPRAVIEIAVLYAEGTQKVSDMLYPKEMQTLMEAFVGYDEPLYPIPVGASVFYFVLIAWVATFYFTYFGRKLLANVKKKLDLHPNATRFPNLPIYWLQQSKREAELRREVRNTWAWLARRYLLSPNDPLLANVDQILGTVNWHDFEVSRNTWSLVKCILRVNALFIKVGRDAAGVKSFEILRDKDLTKIPMQGDRVKRIFEDPLNADYNNAATENGKWPTTSLVETSKYTHTKGIGEFTAEIQQGGRKSFVVQDQNNRRSLGRRAQSLVPDLDLFSKPPAAGTKKPKGKRSKSKSQKPESTKPKKEKSGSSIKVKASSSHSTKTKKSKHSKSKKGQANDTANVLEPIDNLSQQVDEGQPDQLSSHPSVRFPDEINDAKK